MSTTKKSEAFSQITNLVISYLEKGIVPWKLSWHEKGLPVNLYSEKPYRSINLWLLTALDYDEPFFLTAQQAKKMGASVKDDEEPHFAVYWEWSKAQKSELTKEKPAKPSATLKTYALFNVSQCVNVPDIRIARQKRNNHNPLDRCEEMIGEMPNRPTLQIEGRTAYYEPILDRITMFEPDKFPSLEYYYATLLQQLIMSTGHVSRLNRKPYQITETKEVLPFSLEALTADMGASYLCSYCGMDTWNFENRSEYIEGWLQRFKEDKQCLVFAALQALRGVKYILGESLGYATETQTTFLENETA
ncbi:MAG: DUF1738 domain-containing protein [Bacteroidetes bacterium]|nr:DUF1738 domain-containing protein [Bacteroidota bacterium]